MMTSTSSGIVGVQGDYWLINLTAIYRVSPSLLWKPDVALYNKQDLSNGVLAADPKSANTNVQLFSNGHIVWVVPVSHKVSYNIH